MPALFISTMRTVVPFVAGWLLTLLVKAGITIDSEKVTYVVSLVLVVAYYLVFRLLEILGTKLRGSKLQTIAGVLLGWARPPQYPSVDNALPPLTGYRSETRTE
ncbi:hypothetical protein ABZT17_44750 [Streptomyces sp. NPDC005648]|uniref:hypothetical protein n=1 Tax=Streptomyces sp. NPDC005648 TaxID=3157044 RepID=UPI0033AC20F2